ncbi:hypothetical protein JQ616_10165 [Bradyrhizobium tropiciagri]|nr:hypothetical protein [Bradyrhizobium tropiciagri]MBR0895310.1 hypothetical protein [Bradyrhizobium tropiciagri]
MKRSVVTASAGALQDPTAASFGTEPLALGYNAAGKATDPVKAKDAFD